MELTQNGVHYFGATGTGALWFRLNSLTVSRKLKHHVSKKEVKQHPRQAVTMTKLLQAALSGSVQHGHENLYILLTDWSLPSPPSRPRLRPLALLLHFPHLSDLSVQVELFTYSWCWTITSTQHTQKMKTQPASQPRTAGPCRLPYSCSGIHLTTTRLFFFFFYFNLTGLPLEIFMFEWCLKMTSIQLKVLLASILGWNIKAIHWRQHKGFLNKKYETGLLKQQDAYQCFIGDKVSWSLECK